MTRDDTPESIAADYPPGSQFIRVGRCVLVIGPETDDTAHGWQRRLWMQPAPSIYGSSYADALVVGGDKNGLHLYKAGHRMMTGPELLASADAHAWMRRATAPARNPVAGALRRLYHAAARWWRRRRFEREYPRMLHLRMDPPEGAE